MKQRLLMLREEVCSSAKAMYVAGFATGSSGNVSMRVGDHVMITASGIPYAKLRVDQIIEIDFDGTVFSGQGDPSSEWRMHTAIYTRRGDVGAIVHTHSPIATAAAIALPSLPVLHDEGRILFGDTIPVSEHHAPGTWELANAVADALKGSRAVLVANHGVVGVGATLAEAFEVAVKIEEIAHLYLLACQFADTRYNKKHEEST